MGLPRLQGTDYSLAKKSAMSTSGNKVKELKNKKGEIVIVYTSKTDPMQRQAEAFNPDTGKALNSSIFFKGGMTSTTEHGPDGKKISLRHNKNLISVSNYQLNPETYTDELKSVDHYSNNKFTGTTRGAY